MLWTRNTCVQIARLRIKCVRAICSSYATFTALLHHKVNGIQLRQKRSVSWIHFAKGLFIRGTDDNVHEEMEKVVLTMVFVLGYVDSWCATVFRPFSARNPLTHYTNRELRPFMTHRRGCSLLVYVATTKRVKKKQFRKQIKDNRYFCEKAKMWNVLEHQHKCRNAIGAEYFVCRAYTKIRSLCEIVESVQCKHIQGIRWLPDWNRPHTNLQTK